MANLTDRKNISECSRGTELGSGFDVFQSDTSSVWFSQTVVNSAKMNMDIIEAELQELKKVCESSIPDSKLVTCVPSSIRVEIR